MRWLDGRAATVVSRDTATHWHHRDPCDQDRILDEVHFSRPIEITAIVRDLGRDLADRRTPATPPRLARQPYRHRATIWVDALVETIAKPRADAEAEVTYGLALLDHVTATLSTTNQMMLAP